MIHLAIALVVAASSFSYAAELQTKSSMQPLSIKSVHDNPDMYLIQTFSIGYLGSKAHATVDIYADKSLAKRDTKPVTEDPQPKKEIPGITKPLDLTPAKCTSKVCFPGSYEPPLKTDCDALVEAQVYYSIGSLRIKPGWTVLVHAGTCVVVFQHPVGKAENNLTFEYNWASLGQIIIDIQKKCDKPEALSIGGACKIDSYLKYNFENVLISVQRYIAPTTPAAGS